MDYGKSFDLVKNLQFDKKYSLLEEGGTELYIYRPSVLPSNLKNKYDVNKNFQIWFKEETREFKPNHLRIMIDLFLRSRSRPDLKLKLFEIFDNIFYGRDPNKEADKLKGESFDHFLNPSLKLIANLYQFMLIEQEYNYNKESKYDPPTLFLHGWIREFIDAPKEMDNMCMSVANGQPPKVQYTCKDNKKHKKYDPNCEKLWYLNPQ